MPYAINAWPLSKILDGISSSTCCNGTGAVVFQNLNVVSSRRLESPFLTFVTMERFTRIQAPDFFPEAVVTLQFSFDGILLAAACSDGVLYVYDHRKRLLLWKFKGPSIATALRWHSQERYSLFVGEADGSCALYMFTLQKPVRSILLLTRTMG